MKPCVLLLVAYLLLLTGCAAPLRDNTSATVMFAPTPHETVNEMLRLAGVTKNDLVYDLGSGDGRIVIAAARDFGAQAVGVEIDPSLIRVSEENARIAGVSDQARFIEKDLFQVDLREATVVTLFLLPGLNEMLAPKLMKECRPGTRIVSHMHAIGEWQPDKTVRIGDSTIHLYVGPADVAGTWQLDISGAQEFSPLTLSIRQAFQKITATVAIKHKSVRLNDPRVEADRLTFVVAGNISGHNVRMAFSGIVRDNRAEGRVEVMGGPHAGTYQWTALRIQ